MPLGCCTEVCGTQTVWICALQQRQVTAARLHCMCVHHVVSWCGLHGTCGDAPIRGPQINRDPDVPSG
jgi:hypothetical protein